MIDMVTLVSTAHSNNNFQLAGCQECQGCLEPTLTLKTSRVEISTHLRSLNTSSRILASIHSDTKSRKWVAIKEGMVCHNISSLGDKMTL